MIRVTAIFTTEDIEVDQYPHAVLFTVDRDNNLSIHRGYRKDSGEVVTERVVATYPSGHWTRVWEHGQELDDDAFDADDKPGPAPANWPAPRV